MTMTESEARGKIKYRIGVIKEIAGSRYDVKFCEDLEIALQVMKEIREYRELGTVEELKALKEKNGWHDMEMYGLGYNQGTIDRADELQKCREQGYNKAIDEFAEEIAFGIYESVIWDMLATMSKNGSLSDTSDKIVDYVIETSKKIAEKMKGGAE